MILLKNMLNSNIAVSILNAEKKENFLRDLKETVKVNDIKNVSVHIDVMDGMFVKENGVDIEYVKKAKKEGFFVDVHLMVKDPISYINDAVKYGADSITVHFEIENLVEVLKYLKNLKNMKKISNIGLALKPDTKIDNINEYLDYVDMILFMTVEPGYGMQKYMPKVEEKILKINNLNKVIQVDGGINIETIKRAKKCDVNSFVVGSYLTKNTSNLDLRIKELIKEIEG